MAMIDDTDRERLARLIIRKRLDRTVPHPEIRPEDFIAAWLDGDVPIGELPERMGLTGVEVRRMRMAAAEAAAAELGRLAVEAEALADLGRSTEDLVDAVADMDRRAKELEEIAIRIDCGTETLDQALDRLGALTDDEKWQAKRDILAAMHSIADEKLAKLQRD